MTETSMPKSFSARQIDAAVMPGFFIASMKSLSESGSRLFLILSSTDRCCLVDNTSVNLLMWFPSVCECHPEGPRKGITKAPGVTKETLTCMLQKFGHGCTVSDQQLASRMCVLPSQEVGSKQGNLGRSLCHVARRCEFVLGSRTVATRRGHSDLSVVILNVLV